MENNFIVMILMSYLFGSIPFAYILPKIFGIGDIRNIGSGNVGATNVLRTGNKVIAVIVLLFDILKGFIPMFLLKNFIFTNDSLIIYIIGSLAIIGHIFPIWLKLKGGKGVATYIGFLLAANYILGIIFILCWLIVAGFKKYSSLASIVSLIIIPIFILFLSYDNTIVYLFCLISIIVISKHYSNILRLLNKTENKIRF